MSGSHGDSKLSDTQRKKLLKYLDRLSGNDTYSGWSIVVECNAQQYIKIYHGRVFDADGKPTTYYIKKYLEYDNGNVIVLSNGRFTECPDITDIQQMFLTDRVVRVEMVPSDE